MINFLIHTSTVYYLIMIIHLVFYKFINIQKAFFRITPTSLNSFHMNLISLIHPL